MLPELNGNTLRAPVTPAGHDDPLEGSSHMEVNEEGQGEAMEVNEAPNTSADGPVPMDIDNYNK